MKIADAPNGFFLGATILDRVAVQHRAGAEPHEVECIGHLGRLVEVVDAPDQAAFHVTPGAVILQMDIADREHPRRIGKLRAYVENRFGPAPIGRAQERERPGCHLAMLGVDVLLAAAESTMFMAGLRSCLIEVYR